MRVTASSGAVFLVLTLVCPAQIRDAHAEESKILALENAWSQAEGEHNLRALETLLDNRLLYVNYDGDVWSKAQYLASLKTTVSSQEQGVNESMTVRVFVGSAVVIGIYRVKGVTNGKPFLRRERYLDMWVLQDGKWICVASEITLVAH